MPTVDNTAWVNLGAGPTLVTVTAGSLWIQQSVLQPTNPYQARSTLMQTNDTFQGKSTGNYWVLGTSSVAATYSTGAIPGFTPSQGLMGSLALNEYTVATLPPAASNTNVIAAVTDATAVTNGTIVAGSGTNKVNVKSNGVNWLIIA